MTSRRPSRPDILSVEERLLTALERFALLADLFDLQVAIPEHARDGGLSRAACSALMQLCRSASQDVRSLLDALPVDILNVEPREATASRVGPPRRSRRS